MGAREKLNTTHIIGAVGVAGLLGLVTGSSGPAVLAGALLVGGRSIPAMSDSRDVVELRLCSHGPARHQVLAC